MSKTTISAAEQLRQKAKRAGERRRQAELDRERATDELLECFDAARDTPGVTLGEIAAAGGLNRNRLYELERERAVSD